MFDDNSETNFDDETRTCPVTGQQEKKSMISTLNKKGRLTRHELDEIFLDDD